MSRRRKRLAWLALASFSVMYLHGHRHSDRSIASSEVHWYTDENEALAESKQRGVPVFIDFRASWCESCQQMEKTLFVDPEVRQRLGHFVSLKIDVSVQTPANDILLKRYGISGLPALVFLDRQGKLVANQTAHRALTKSELLQRLGSF